MSSGTGDSVSRQVCVRLPMDLAKELESVIDESPYDIAKSEIIRTALREHLENR